jgi:hypothetical protein
MILLHFAFEDEQMLYKAAEKLLSENLVVDLTYDSSFNNLKLKDGKIVVESIYLMTGITKGLLYNKIEATLKEHLKAEILNLYSTPIIHMDWLKAEQLSEQILKV